MSELTIQFIDVGLRKFNTTVTFKAKKENHQFSSDDVAFLVRKWALNHCVFHSSPKNVRITYNSLNNEGTVYDGFHLAGSFKTHM